MKEGAWAIAVATVFIGCPARAQTGNTAKVDAVIAKTGLQTTRGVEFDVAFPANAKEYLRMGKNGILKVSSQSAISTELPLRTVYIVVKGVRVALQRVLLLDPNEDAQGRATQISFYLIPLHLMKADATLNADFRGDRSGFNITTFSAASRDPSMPPFVRLDEYDMPQDPDLTVVGAVLHREYPETN